MEITYNYYKDFGTGEIRRYLVGSMYDTPDKREKASELAYNSSHCQIDSCLEFDNGCDRKHKKGAKGVKCKDYKSRFKTLS